MARKRDRTTRKERMSAAAAARRDRAMQRSAATRVADVAVADAVAIAQVVDATEVVSAPIEGAIADARVLVDPATRARAAAFAAAVRAACTDADERLATAVAARDDQQMAWLVLCDRGWPATHTVLPQTMKFARAWLAEWQAFVALPVKLGLTDKLRHRSVLQRLADAEKALRPVVPPPLWRLVEPLDDTGRGTLAHALHALVQLEELSTRADAADREKTPVRERFEALATEAGALDLEAPEARLDLEAWRALADLAADLAGEDAPTEVVAT